MTTALSSAADSIRIHVQSRTTNNLPRLISFGRSCHQRDSAMTLVL